MQPGLTDLQMEFDTPAGVTCLTIPPLIPPIVFAEEKLQIYILIRGQVGSNFFTLFVRVFRCIEYGILKTVFSVLVNARNILVNCEAYV